jgi:hypothetical protein
MGLRGIWARSLGVNSCGQEAVGADLVAGMPTLSSLNLGRQAGDVESGSADPANFGLSTQKAGIDAAWRFRFMIKADDLRFNDGVTHFT